MDYNNLHTYDELDENEKEIVDTLRSLKLLKDHATFSLFSFQLADLIDDYEQLKNLRESIQLKYFTIFENIKNSDLVDGDLDANLWGYNRNNEKEVWKSELDLIMEIKNSLDFAIELIESGEAEKRIIDEENNVL